MNETVSITSLDHEGRGVARLPDGKIAFIEGALPREQVAYTLLKHKTHYATGKADIILTESFMRDLPCCPHFGQCGGCSLQHVEASAQIAVKTEGLGRSCTAHCQGPTRDHMACVKRPSVALPSPSSFVCQVG